MPACTAIVSKRFDYHTLQFASAGRVELSYDDARVELDGPHLWPAFPGPYVRFQRAAGCDSWNHRYAAFAGSGVHQLVDPARALRQPLAVPPERLGAVVGIFDELIGAASVNDPLSRMTAVNLLQRLLLLAAEFREATEQHREPWLDAVLEQLDAAGPKPDYERIARGSGMALSTLRRKFRRATGVAIHEYHLRTRLAEARRLLAETSSPIKELAARLGYADVFYFTRQFSQKVGVSPGAYRASVQSGRRPA
jgi:AraC-like DNA-binding protein